MDIEKLLNLLDLIEVYYYIKKDEYGDNPKILEIECAVDTLINCIKNDIKFLKHSKEQSHETLQKKHRYPTKYKPTI